MRSPGVKQQYYSSGGSSFCCDLHAVGSLLRWSCRLYSMVFAAGCALDELKTMSRNCSCGRSARSYHWQCRIDACVDRGAWCVEAGHALSHRPSSRIPRPTSPPPTTRTLALTSTDGHPRVGVQSCSTPGVLQATANYRHHCQDHTTAALPSRHAAAATAAAAAATTAADAAHQLDLLRERPEGERLAHGELRQHLAVEAHVERAQAGLELGVLDLMTGWCDGDVMAGVDCDCVLRIAQ